MTNEEFIIKVNELFEDFSIVQENVGVPNDVMVNSTYYIDFRWGCFFLREREILKHNIVYESSNFFYSSNDYYDYEKYYDELIIFKELVLPKYL